VRQVYESIVIKLNASYVRTKSHDTQTHDLRSINATLQYTWDPFLEKKMVEDILLTPTTSGAAMDNGLLFVGAGLHYAAFKNDSVNAFKTKMDALFQMENEERSHKKAYSTYIMPVLPSNYSVLPKEKQLTMTKEKIDAMNDYLSQSYSSSKGEPQLIWAYNEMIKDAAPLDAHDGSGVHVLTNVADWKADILLNHYCNPILEKEHLVLSSASCCVSSLPRTAGQVTAILLFAMTSFLATSVMIIMAILGQEGKEGEESYTEQTSLRLKRSKAALHFSSACLLCFICDKTQAFDKLIKQQDVLLFVCLSAAVLLLVGLGTIQACRAKTQSALSLAGEKVVDSDDEDEAPLSRFQTEEWKGWMQAIILLYHWTGTSHTLWVYKVIRLLVAAYLFMTGYGNTMHLLTDQGSISAKRIVGQLLRLNILSIALAHIMDTSYSNYYFAPLVSFWLLVTYGCLGVRRSWNDSLALLSVKVMICMALTTSVILIQGGPVELTIKALQLISGGSIMDLDAKAVRFRVGLDLYVVYVGMMCAAVVQRLPSSTNKVEPIPVGRKNYLWRNRFFLSSIGCAAILLSGWYFIAHSKTKREQYNSVHPFVSPLAILAFVLLRNCHPFLRRRYSSGFARLGRCSLETFTLQYHMFLANNTHGALDIPILRFIPRLGWMRWLDLVVCAVPFLIVSEKTWQGTQTLVTWFCTVGKYPQDERVAASAVSGQVAYEQLNSSDDLESSSASTEEEEYTEMSASSKAGLHYSCLHQWTWILCDSLLSRTTALSLLLVALTWLQKYPAR
jgi:hypothetical protein